MHTYFQKRNVFLLFCVVGLFHKSELVLVHQRMWIREGIEGKYVLSAMSSFPATSIQVCAVSCLRHGELCMAFTFDTEHKLCHLSPVLKATGAPGWESLLHFTTLLTESEETTTEEPAVTSQGPESPVPCPWTGYWYPDFYLLLGKQTCIQAFNSSSDQFVWQVAKDRCASFNQGSGTLVSLFSQHEMEALRNILVALGQDNQDYWVGGTDSAHEGTFVWQDGQGVNSDLFAANQPETGSAGDAEDCLFLSTSGPRLELGDMSCSSTLAYICELNP